MEKIKAWKPKRRYNLTFLLARVGGGGRGECKGNRVAVGEDGKFWMWVVGTVV